MVTKYAFRQKYCVIKNHITNTFKALGTRTVQTEENGWSSSLRLHIRDENSNTAKTQSKQSKTLSINVENFGYYFLYSLNIRVALY